MPKEQMVNRPSIVPVPKLENDILIVGHQEHMIMGPAQIYIGGWAGLEFGKFPLDQSVGKRQFRQTLKRQVFPFSSLMPLLRDSSPPHCSQ